MKGIAGLSLLPLLAVASPIIPSSIHNGAAPILSSSNAEEIPDSYIIVFKNHVDAASAAAHQSWVQDIHMQHNELRKRSFPFTGDLFKGLKSSFDIAGSFLGYSGHFDENVIDAIRRHPDVSLFLACRRPTKGTVD
jgi:cerevisin